MLPVTNDERPPVWVGHVLLGATDIDRSNDYYAKLGMRPIEKGEDYAVLELRGGTHLVLNKQEEAVPEGSAATFDVMVEDIDLAWKEYEALGFQPGEIHEQAIHRFFTLCDPSGFTVLVISTHVSEHPV